MRLKDKGLNIIEALASDDLSESLSYDAVMGREIKLSQEDMKILGHKLSTIYRVSHCLLENAICYEVHDDWRKDINRLYRKYNRRGII